MWKSTTYSKVSNKLTDSIKWSYRHWIETSLSDILQITTVLYSNDDFWVQNSNKLSSLTHSVWSAQKKSHSTLRAKRATFTFWVNKSWLKMPKMVHFGEFLYTGSLRSNRVTREVSCNRSKNGGKCQNWKVQMLHFGWLSNIVYYPNRTVSVRLFDTSKCVLFSIECTRKSV